MESQKKKTKPNRLEYLDQLVVEFQNTKSRDAKEQVLANLGNFAYDPANYNYFRQLNILDLFLDTLSSTDDNLIRFSMGGLCNLCLDPENKTYIYKNGLKQITKLLEHRNTDIKACTITTLMFLMSPESKQDITNNAIIKTVVELKKSENSKLKNLATIFLEDYCWEKQIESVSTMFCCQ